MQKFENNDNEMADDVKTTEVNVIKFSLKQTLLSYAMFDINDIVSVNCRVTFDAGLKMHKSENIVEIFHLFALISCPNKHGNENG